MSNAMEATIPTAMVHGHRMLLHDTKIDRYISPSLSAQGVFEPMETAFVLQEVRPGDIVLDIGANIGYFTLLFAKLVGPQGQVIAFEPDPKNFSLLTQNVKINGYRNVVLVNKAVSERTNTGFLYLSDFNSGDHRIYDSADGRPSVPINTVSLDDYFSNSLMHFNLIKFDIQGAEWSALQGMTQLIKRHPRLKMIMEYWPIGLRRSGAEPEKFLALLQHFGFCLWELNENARTIQPTTSAELLANYRPDLEFHTNLLCFKQDCPTENN